MVSYYYSLYKRLSGRLGYIFLQNPHGKAQVFQFSTAQASPYSARHMEMTKLANKTGLSQSRERTSENGKSGAGISGNTFRYRYNIAMNLLIRRRFEIIIDLLLNWTTQCYLKEIFQFIAEILKASSINALLWPYGPYHMVKHQSAVIWTIRYRLYHCKDFVTIQFYPDKIFAERG